MRLTKAFYKRIETNPVHELALLSIEDLEKLVKKTNDAYYNTGAPLISDDIYDLIKDTLRARDNGNKALDDVGADIKQGNKVNLPVWMGSMDKIKADPKALDNFKKKCDPAKFTVMDKLDGVSALFTQHANSSALYTRGNGKVGQDVSHLIPFIKGFPKLKSTDPLIQIRGELILSKASWTKLKAGANPRNAVSGIVNAKHPNPDILKLIEFIPYAVIKPEMQVNKQIQFVHKLGFTPVNTVCITGPKMTIEELSAILDKRRKTSPYEVDGLVISHNEYHPPVAGKNPTYAFAFKHLLTQDVAEVIVSNVEWHVSKDGLIKPTVIFPPVKISGVTIRRATGFNGEFINSNKIGPGSHLTIIRSGDVIPHITAILKSSEHPQMPDIPWVWTEGGKEIRTKIVTNAQDERQLTYFFEKLKVRGFSVKTVEKLYAAGYKTVKDIIAMPNGTIRQELHNALKQGIKDAHILTLMHASNTFGQGFGERKLTLVLNRIPKVANGRYQPTMEELEALEGFSKISAKKYIEGLAKFRTFCEVNGLTTATTTSATPSPIHKRTGNKWENQVIVFTGFRNKEWEATIIANGGTVGSTITGKTTIVVAKDTDKLSSKIQKALDKGIRIIKMDDFQP